MTHWSNWLLFLSRLHVFTDWFTHWVNFYCIFYRKRAQVSDTSLLCEPPKDPFKKTSGYYSPFNLVISIYKKQLVKSFL